MSTKKLLSKTIQAALVGVSFMGMYNSANAVIGFPEIAFDGYVFSRTNSNCESISCGKPIGGAKVTLELVKDKISFRTKVIGYSDSSGYYNTGFALGCGKVKVTYEYNGVVDVYEQYSASCLMLGKKTKTIHWAIDQNRLTGGSNNQQKPAKTLQSIRLSCPSSVNENRSSAGTCTAKAYYTDRTNKTITPSWSDNSSALSVNSGKISTSNVSRNTSVTVTATYKEGSVTKQATATVTVKNIK
jgi:hypothetical protein